ncbi:MAG: type II secretion system protein GspG [Planctomycetes bacterium]|nr:type II secretion system protein GspG [Planctomycetota bacterium]MCB9936319.1 type II secretion system protein GspG [Planctomycetota bacterium]
MRRISVFLVLLLAGCGGAGNTAAPNVPAGNQDKPAEDPAEQAKLKQARSDMLQIKEGVENYWFDRGHYPLELEDIAKLTGNPIPTDPFGAPYKYEPEQFEYTITCLGSDGKEGGSGPARDIVLTKEGFRD